MVGLIMLAKVLSRAVQASFHRGNTRGKNFGDLRVAAAFLDESEQRAILWAKLGERVPQRIELLRVDRAGRLGNIFVFLAERQKNPPQLLAPQLVDARVAGQPEKPRFKLRRRLQTIERADHFDKNLLREIFDVITSTGHSINEAGDPMLVSNNELPLGGFVPLLGPPHKVGERSR
jgi:hypothetical protein